MPKVAVCVAMRNEEGNILSLIQSLLIQSYADYDVFIIDDHSQDDSFNVVSEFEAQNFNVSRAREGTVGKSACLNELTKALSINYDVLAFTDADCVLDKDWISNMVKYLEANDLVADETLVVGDSFLQVFEKIEYREVFGIVRFMGTLSVLPSMMGNNFAIKHSLFQSIGGYEDITNSIVEDVDLLRLVNAADAKTLMLSDCKVRTNVDSDWSDLVKQRLRWSKGVHFSTGYVLLGLIFVIFKLAPYILLLTDPIFGLSLCALRWSMIFCFTPLKFRQLWSAFCYDFYQVFLYAHVLFASRQRVVIWQGRIVGN